jgi:hypothetical protein
MKRRILFLLAMVLPLILAAQELHQNLKKPSKLYIGTPFSIEVEIVSGLQDSIFAPQLDSLDVFFLLGEPKQTEIIEKEQKRNLVTLSFQAFDTGEYTFPELEFLVRTPGNDKILTTHKFVVIINTILPDSASVIKDIASPVTLSLGFWDYFIPILAFILLIVIIRIILKLLKRPGEDEPEPEIIDTRKPFEIAREMLKILIEEKLLERGELIEYYYRLSVILRFFLERQYKINALEMTTSEIRHQLKLADNRAKSEILFLLTESDKVKFARFIPDSALAEKLTSWLDAYLLSFKLKQVEADDA